MKNRIQAALSRANDKTKGLSAAELEELSQESFEYTNRPEIVNLPIEWRAYSRNTIAFILFTGIICTSAAYSTSNGFQIFSGVVFGAWLGQMSNWVGAYLQRQKTISWPQTRRMTGEESKASAETFWEELNK